MAGDKKAEKLNDGLRSAMLMGLSGLSVAFKLDWMSRVDRMAAHPLAKLSSEVVSRALRPVVFIVIRP